MDMASACLVGVCCRYDGGDKTKSAMRERFMRGEILAFCPETLGGLAVPRPPMRLDGGTGGDVLDGIAKIVSKAGGDTELLTGALIKGAKKSGAIAAAVQPGKIYLKSKSVSCGVTDNGVTAELLRRAGFRLVEM